MKKLKVYHKQIAVILSVILFCLQACKNKEVEIIDAVPPKKSDVAKSENLTPHIVKKGNANFRKKIVLQDTISNENVVDTQSLIPIIGNLLKIDSIVSLSKDTIQAKVEIVDTTHIEEAKPIVVEKNVSNDTMFIGYNIDTMMNILGIPKPTKPTKPSLNLTKKKKKPNTENNVLQIGPLIGTDVGGGVPFGNIPKDFVPYPKLNISLGLWFNYMINKHWQLGFTTTYKTVALAADARMRNEYFAAAVPALTGNNEVVRVYYTGKARQSMSFTMLEFPLIAKYGFGSKGQYRVAFGGYGAWIMDRSFLVTAKTGYQGFNPNEIGVIIPKEGLALDFSNTLRNWEAGLVLGYEQAITSRLNVDFTIYGGLNDIVKQGERFLTYGMFPMRLGIHASYSLFEFAPAEDKKFRFVYK